MASSKYTDIISTFPVGIYILHLEDDHDDKSFRILAFNTYAEKEIGVLCDKYVNKPLFDLFPGMEGGMSVLLKQVSQTKKECNFGTVPYSDNRIKYSLFKMRAFPLPSKCVALMLENTSNATSNSNEKTEIFMSIIFKLESSLDSILQDIYKQNHKGVLSHMLCHLLSFFASQLNEKSEKIETTDVMNVVDMVLLSEKYSSNDLIRQFLITYRYFTTPSILLNVLILRCMTQSYYLKRKPQEEEKLLSRTVMIFVEWIDNHFYDFVANRKLLTTIKSFISLVVTKSEFDSVRSWEFPLLTLLEDKLRSQKVLLSVPIRKIVSHQSINAMDLLDFPPSVWANQMTMILAERFYSIKNPEFYKGAWTKADKDFKAPNVTSLIEMNNRFSKWIITEICSCFNPTRRVQLLKHFVEMCHETFQYKDFESFFIIATSLMNSSVSRLTVTWKSLDSKTTKMWSKLEVYATPLRNFSKFREHLTDLIKGDHQEPIIPYLALCLRDLSVIDETNESYMDDRINFRKMELLAAPISQIMTLQQNEFRFPRNLRIKAFLLHDIPLLHEKEQYENSLICQPIGDSTLSPEKLRKLSQSSPKLPRSAVTSPGKSSSPAIARKLFGTLSKEKTLNKRGSMPESFFAEAPVKVSNKQPVRLSRKQSCDDFTISYEKLIMKKTTEKPKEVEVLREFDKNMLDVNLEVILEEMKSVNGTTEMKSILEAKLRQLDCN